MSLSRLAAVDPAGFDVVSTDLFDTVLLRDLSLQDERFADGARLGAAALRRRAGQSPDARALALLRASTHRLAYRAVAAERPAGEATLTRMTTAQATLLGGDGVAGLLRDAELAVEQRRLWSHVALLRQLNRFAAAGKRVVAVSDTWYSADDLAVLLERVVGVHPIAGIHASSELGLTKHAGGIFAEVARREGVATGRILHLGDNFHADVAMARAAGCQAVHLPRGRAHRLAHDARAVLMRSLGARLDG